MKCADQAPPFQTIVFDCDSTLAAIEGIDALCSPEQRESVAALTDRAMQGELPLEAVFGQRLELVRPSRADLERVTQAYIESALLNAKQSIALLKRAEKRLVIVSGGLLPAVEGFARWLGIDEVRAVPIQFDAEGRYAGFGNSHPLANAGGKIEVVRQLREGAGSREAMVLIGDGATDLEAAGEVQRFIAFGGVVRRENVFAAASIQHSSPNFAQLLPLLLSPAEIEAARDWPEFAPLLSQIN